MDSAARLDWRRILLRGVAAGLTGGVLLHLFFYLATLLPQHASILSMWQVIASAAIGKAAFSSTSYAWLGLAMHFAVSIAWGCGYSYLSDVNPVVNERPILSGAVYGFIVYIIMQLALAGVGLLVIRSGMQVITGIIARTLFFGIPLALVNDRLRSHIA